MRGRPLHRVFSGDQRGTLTGGVPSGPPPPPVHPGVSQRGGGLPLPPASISIHGVIPSPPHLRQTLETMGDAANRRVCHLPQQEASPLLFPSPGSSSVGSGCLPTTMAPQGSLPLSPHQDHQTGPAEIQAESGSVSHPHCPNVAPAVVVSRPPRPRCRSTQTPSSMERPARLQCRSDRVPPARYFSFSRLEALLHLFRE